MLAWIRKLLKPTGGVIENKTAELCVGCQQAMLRISHGTQETHCPVCGCHWMSKEAADMYKKYHPRRPDQVEGCGGVKSPEQLQAKVSELEEESEAK